MAREPQAWVHSGLGMGIILTMPDQMTPVIESSVVMAQVFCSSSAMPVSAASQIAAETGIA